MIFIAYIPSFVDSIHNFRPPFAFHTHKINIFYLFVNKCFATTDFTKLPINMK